MVDSWRPSASIHALQARSSLYQQLRAFFQARHYLEVDVPLLARGGTTDPHIQSFQTHCLTDLLYLQTSPEFAMKRLLAAGSGPIYALTKSFRLEEQGRYHNPEFAILEWYRPGFDDRQLMQEIAELLAGFLDLPQRMISYKALFMDMLGVNPHTVELDTLQQRAKQLIDIDATDESKDFWLELLFSHHIQPSLRDQICFVFDYPASQAALAKVTSNKEGESVAKRFEVFVNTVELANGYWELTDPDEQARRFQQDNQQRARMGLPEIKPSHELVESLKAGMPESAGVALGVDRLLMAIMGAQHIDDVIAFPMDRA